MPDQELPPAPDEKPDAVSDTRKAVLLASASPANERRDAAFALFGHALETRDADLALLVARQMDADPELDAALAARLNAALASTPDLVYAFVRARLGDGVDARWVERLQVAAMCALQVALTDGDTETAANWLRLVAREPAAYELGWLVHESILAARARARREGDLGRAIVPLAVRRAPAALDLLLNDSALIEAMTGNLGRALRDFEGDSQLILQNHGSEVFLVVIARASAARHPALITPAVVEQVWHAYTGTQPALMPSGYSADRTIRLWIETGADWLDDAAFQMLLTLALRDRRDDTFLHGVQHFAAARPDDLARLLGGAFVRSGRGEPELLALLTQLHSSSDLAPQTELDVLVRVLTAWEWRRAALVLAQAAARLLGGGTPLDVSGDALWALLDFADAVKDEALARPVLRRITAELEATEDENLLADVLIRLHGQVAWNPALRLQLMNWWRGFVRACTLARLQRIDKGFDSKRGLDDYRPTLYTAIAVRKLIGKRTLAQFAADVATSYAILQAFAEAFDPTQRRPLTFDAPTVKAELDARADELPAHDQTILASNLKELAELIATMGDNRTKASLIRRTDDVDRLLMTGEQQPHSAVDVLKWLSGYLGGTQDDESDE